MLLKNASFVKSGIKKCQLATVRRREQGGRWKGTKTKAGWVEQKNCISENKLATYVVEPRVSI